MSGRDDDPRAGHPNGHPNGDSPEMPADLAAVQADDVLLDMLGSGGPTPGDADDELTRVLAAWRRDVHADSNRLLVDTDTALAVISAARRPIRRRGPIFGPIAAAAAVFVIAFSAVGLLAKSAQPGDNLWGVTEVLYSDYARSVETAASVRTELEQAKKALQENKPEQAKESLDRIRQQLPVIAEAEGKADLTTQHHELERELVASPPAQGSQPEPPDVSSPEKPAAPGAPPSSATPSPSPDLNSSPEPSPSPEPTPSPSPEPTPSPELPYPTPGTGQNPQPNPSPAPDDQSTQPSAKPIHSSPSDFRRPAPPASPNSPSRPPSPKPSPPEPPSMGMPADPDSSMSGDQGYPDPRYRGPVEPDRPRTA
ncbi:MAG: anti-sigma-D factor RsdA [Pseudonocardiaceae bacterium]